MLVVVKRVPVVVDEMPVVVEGMSVVVNGMPVVVVEGKPWQKCSRDSSSH